MLIKPLGIFGEEQRYCRCCYNLLGNAISLISESYQSASPFHSHCAVPVLSLFAHCHRQVHREPARAVC